MLQDILSVVGLVGTLTGILVAIVQGRRISDLESKRIRLFWADLEAAAREVGLTIKRQSKNTPKVIFAPSARAATFANLLMYQIGHDIPLFVGIIESREGDKLIVKPKHYTQIETRKWNVFVPDAIYELKNYPLLIVDDLTMTGTTLKGMIQQFEKVGFKEIKTTAVVVTESAIQGKNAPDYYWRVIGSPDFYFPWGKAL